MNCKVLSSAIFSLFSFLRSHFTANVKIIYLKSKVESCNFAHKVEERTYVTIQLEPGGVPA